MPETFQRQPGCRDDYDLIVIGGGPAGQKAAVQGAKAGARVLLVDREARPGGECVRRGTIPSKTLRETALHLAGLRGGMVGASRLAEPLDRGVALASLMRRLEAVIAQHERFIGAQLERNGIEFRRASAHLTGPGRLTLAVQGAAPESLCSSRILLATGSRPRPVPAFPVDGRSVLDSDTILGIEFLPRSLIVLGAGVIACEFATIFQALGVPVTLIDKAPRLLPFFDPELCDRFAASFDGAGGTRLHGVEPVSMECVPCPEAANGEAVRVHLADGRAVEADALLVALGRRADVRMLGLENVGLTPDARGFLPVDAEFRTAAEGIWAVGDLIGPPALAATAMEQGRRAARAALGLPPVGSGSEPPVGIYTIPELAGFGLSEAAARERFGEEGVLVGRARFDELARGQISGCLDGLLKLVCDRAGERVLGVQIVGEGASELVHLGQLAVLGSLGPEALVDNVFNFPTLAEAYRVAALDVLGQRARLRRSLDSAA